MSPRYYHKSLKWLLLMLPLIMAAGLLGTYYTHQLAARKTLVQQPVGKKPPQPKFQIVGLDLHSTIDGREALAVKAKRFAIQKKKLGLFRFGLMNEALFENAHVRLYGEWQTAMPFKAPSQTIGEVRESTAKGRLGASPDTPPLIAAGHEGRLVFKNVFSTAAFPDLPMNKVSAIEMKPVEVALYDQQTCRTRISASKAYLRFRQRDIRFKGKVKVVAGRRVLTTGELMFVPEEAALYAVESYTLQTPEGRWTGQRMATNIFLDTNRSIDPGKDINR